MNPVKEDTKTVNEVLKFVGEELIPLPTEGSTKQKLESLLVAYTEKLIAMNPQYKKVKNKKMYLNNMIKNQEGKNE